MSTYEGLILLGPILAFVAFLGCGLTIAYLKGL